ncbi:transcriptional regulator [Rivularia sp. PCC 7116]|uniref:LysR family transcriptional regulator n=1 Tax=Rivularia sp. PCC 7116 TaxID=373994 RepID=UPI00029EFFA0|nr:LysR family transcriptional regulator [Rivularia sp. PCC 7116]AFY57190.1 transcriptional regulator [Rivularia sp. PCC 7116]
MDLSQLRYFLAIVETQGFTKAAELLFVSQPSLSAGIKKLEQELGVILFERGGRRAVLTPAGKIFLEKARNIINEYQSALNTLQDFQQHPTLRLGVVCTLRISVISSLVSAFRFLHPNITIELKDSYVNNLNNLLEQGEVDLILTVLDSDENSDSSVPLFQQQLLLAVASIHPFAQRKEINISELDGQPYIERVNCEFWRKNPLVYKSAGIKTQTVYLANQEEWVIYLIQQGLGISFMPVWSNLSGITYVGISDVNTCRTVGLKWKSEKTSELVDLFRTFAATQSYTL